MDRNTKINGIRSSLSFKPDKEFEALTTAEAVDHLRSRGWVLLPSVLIAGLRDRLTEAMELAHVKVRRIQLANGVGDGTDGTLHHLPIIDEVFLEFLQCRYCGDILDAFFGGPYLLNTFGGVLNLPNNLSYVGAIHRDQRTFSGDLPLMCQLLVMLDDFTEDNGATYFLDGSHLRSETRQQLVFCEGQQSRRSSWLHHSIQFEPVACRRQKFHEWLPKGVNAEFF